MLHDTCICLVLASHHIHNRVCPCIDIWSRVRAQNIIIHPDALTTVKFAHNVHFDDLSNSMMPQLALYAIAICSLEARVTET